MTMLMLALAVVALVVLAGCAVTGLFLLSERRRLDVIATRLAGEQRIEARTRAALQAMRDAVRQQSKS